MKELNYGSNYNTILVQNLRNKIFEFNKISKLIYIYGQYPRKNNS